MKSLIHLLEGDIICMKAAYIKEGYNFDERDEATVKEMQTHLLGDRPLLKELGWGKYKPVSKVLHAKTYIVALENYISLKRRK